MTEFSNLKGLPLKPSAKAFADAIARLENMSPRCYPDRRIIPPDVWDWLQANCPEALR